MQRSYIKAVTSNPQLPILIRCSSAASEGVATFQQEFGAPQPVRALRLEEVISEVRHLSQSDGQHFRAMIALKQALGAKHDAIALERAIEMLNRAYELRRAEPQLASIPKQLAESLGKLANLSPMDAADHLKFLRPGPRALQDPGWLLSYELSTQLFNAQIVLWWANQSFRGAVWCPNMKTALYARALLNVLGSKGIRICPHCEELFLQTRSDQNYCTVAHREAHRLARWRKEQKQRRAEMQEPAKQRRDNGTDKTR